MVVLSITGSLRISFKRSRTLCYLLQKEVTAYAVKDDHVSDIVTRGCLLFKAETGLTGCDWLVRCRVVSFRG